MTIDMDLTLKSLSFLLSVGAIVYAFFTRRRKDVDERFKDGAGRMNRHETRLQTLEQTMGVMPGKDDIHALRIELVKQTGQLGEMRAVMSGNAKIMERLEVIVSRHEDHLLEGVKK